MQVFSRNGVPTLPIEADEEDDEPEQDEPEQDQSGKGYVGGSAVPLPSERL